MQIVPAGSFKHGTAKLQASTSTMVSIGGNDGGAILIQSATTKDYQLSTNFGLSQELFNNTANIEGISNQSLSPNTLYSVYIANIDGKEWNNELQFWPTFDNNNPTLENNGLYVNSKNGSTYLGQIYTNNCNIITVMGSTENLVQNCYSHFNPWSFGFQTTQVSGSFKKSMSGSQSTPSILTVTEGISDCPIFNGQLTFKGGCPGSTVSYYIKVEGTSIGAIGGSNWVCNSPIQTVKILNPFRTHVLNSMWGSAPPIGIYKATPVIIYTGIIPLIYSTELLGQLYL